MGQKVNPHGLRVGVIKDWDSRWYASNEKVGDLLVEDNKIRNYLKSSLYAAGIPKVEIERDSARVRVFLHCARPGMVIGKGGQEIEVLRKKLEDMISKPVALNIIEIRNPDLNAQLVAENVAAQIEKRVSYRRAMKQAIGRAMRMGARGIKIAASGRLAGAEIARYEHYHEGTIPLQTIRADIDYGFAEAQSSGKIGIKVWIYKGEVLQTTGRRLSRSLEAPRPPRRNDDRRGDRRDRRNGDRRDNRGGDRRNNDRGGFNNRQGGSQAGARQGGYNNNNRQGGYNRPQGGSRPANPGTREGGER